MYAEMAIVANKRLKIATYFTKVIFTSTSLMAIYFKPVAKSHRNAPVIIEALSAPVGYAVMRRQLHT